MFFTWQTLPANDKLNFKKVNILNTLLELPVKSVYVCRNGTPTKQTDCKQPPGDSQMTY